MTVPNFQALIDAHHDEIFRYLWRLAYQGNARETGPAAKDLTQETFLRAYRAYDRLQPDSNVRAWLYKIATNCARSAFRSRRREDKLAEEVGQARGDAPSLEDRRIRKEQSARLREAVSALPFKQRSAVTLRHLQGVSYEEIAAVLQCSPESARANVYQGLKRLRATLAVEEDLR